MELSEFTIGESFFCDETEWRCTDIGTRTIAALRLSDHRDDPSWFNGPPYACAEFIFDEDSQLSCTTS